MARCREEPAEPAATGTAAAFPVWVGDESVDLLTLGSVALGGDRDQVDELLCSFVVDVVGGRPPRPAAVLVGFGHEMHALEGVTAVDDEVAALRAVEAATAQGGAAGAGVVIFVDRHCDGPHLAALVAAAENGAGGHDGAGAQGAGHGTPARPAVALVVAGERPDARWLLQAGREPLAEALTEQLPSTGTARPAITAFRSWDPASRAEPGRPAGRVGSEPATPVEVRILGHVCVTGTPSPLDRRPRLTELVVYLAMHPDGATTDAWATALWPDRRMSTSTVANRLSEARLALGVARDGFAHLRKSGGRHHLGPEVSTDWDWFLALKAKHEPEAWREALGLIRGRPFEGLREPQWTLLEGFVASIESNVVEVACRLAEHLLATSDPEGAEWAARRAMLVCPWDERLYRLVMRAEDAAGNRAGIEAVLRQLGRVLEADGNPLAAVHPETAALYRSLVNRRQAL